PADSSIQLEEKGSVYTEMVSVFEGTWWNVNLKLMTLMYGEDHPFSNESAGYPPAIREATAEDLSKFHSDHYHLNNMGMIVSIADDIPLDDFLSRTSEIFARIEPNAEAGDDPATTGERFPEPQSAPYGTIAIADFPHQNENEPGLILMVWPPVVKYDPYETIIRDLLISNVARGQGSNLYKRFIDSQTREMDIGASDVFGRSSENQGCPFFIGFSDVKQEVINEATIDSIRALVIAEIESLANFADDSDELKEFNERAANRVTQNRRQLRKRLNSPPRFGFRGASFWWMEYLHEQYRIPGFRKQLSGNDRMKFVEDLLDSGKNFWKDYIAKWQLLTNKPYAVGAKANPEMIATMEAERDKRIEGYIEDFKKKYGVDDKNEALAKFVAEYDAKTDIIDKETATIETPLFVDSPPLTFDEHLNYRVDKLPGDGDNVISTFDNMTSAKVGLYLDMTVVPESLLLYASALPTMLTEVGVVKDGEPLPYDKTGELLRKEILNYDVRYVVNYRTERVELQLTASGSNLDESVKGVDWISTFLYDADWRTENLPRMRDAIDASLTSARNGWKGWEEGWVGIPINTYLRQTNPLILTTMCFLTHQHSLMRVKWLLKEADTPETLKEFDDFIAVVSKFGGNASRDQLTALATFVSTGTKPETETELPADIVSKYEGLSEPASQLVKAAGDDLLQNLSGFPDGSLTVDWTYLCQLMSDDLAVPAHKTLDKFLALMEVIRKQDNVRGYMVGSEVAQKELLPYQNSLVERFSDEASVKQVYSDAPVVHSRLRARTSDEVKPVYVGLVKESTRNGLVSNSAPTASFYDSDPNTLLDFLAARLYGGGGAHSMFMKTWAAGLAYSNGLRSNQYTGRLSYYAERCPSLVQTV
ncbi:MAG: insulinase family protein, partial [candidate division Zixibacteria bacterium]